LSSELLPFVFLLKHRKRIKAKNERKQRLFSIGPAKYGYRILFYVGPKRGVTGPFRAQPAHAADQLRSQVDRSAADDIAAGPGPGSGAASVHTLLRRHPESPGCIQATGRAPASAFTSRPAAPWFEAGYVRCNPKMLFRCSIFLNLQYASD